jgi:hypothetical protein
MWKVFKRLLNRQTFDIWNLTTSFCTWIARVSWLFIFNGMDFPLFFSALSSPVTYLVLWVSRAFDPILWFYTQFYKNQNLFISSCYKRVIKCHGHKRDLWTLHAESVEAFFGASERKVKLLDDACHIYESSADIENRKGRKLSYLK